MSRATLTDALDTYRTSLQKLLKFNNEMAFIVTSCRKNARVDSALHIYFFYILLK